MNKERPILKTLKVPSAGPRSPSKTPASEPTDFDELDDGAMEFEIEPQPDGNLLLKSLRPAIGLDALKGRWRLSQAGHDIVLLKRARGTGTRPSLAGELDATDGITSVLSSIHQNRWSGVLRINDGLLQPSIAFHEGDVRSALSNLHEHRLGQVLYRHGRVEETHIKQALSLRNRRIGEALVSLGILAPEELEHFIRQQTSEIFIDMMKLRSGTFWFERGDVSDSTPAITQISTQELLMEGVRIIDELSRMKRRIPSKDSIVTLKEDVPDSVDDTDVRSVLGFIDGKRTVEELGRLSRLGEFRAMHGLYRLIKGGYAELKRELVVVAQRMDQQGDLSAHRVIEIFQNIFVDVAKARAPSGAGELLEQHRGVFMRDHREYRPLLRGVRFDRDGRLDRPALLRNFEELPVQNPLDILRETLSELLAYLGAALDVRVPNLASFSKELGLSTKDLEVERSKPYILTRVGNEVAVTMVAQDSSLEDALGMTNDIPRRDGND